MEHPSVFRAPAVIAHLPRVDGVQWRSVVFAYLKGYKGLLILAAGLGITGLLTGWMWLGAAAVLPLLYTLPCVVMMAMCMRGHGRSDDAPAKSNGSAGSEPDMTQ